MADNPFDPMNLWKPLDPQAMQAMFSPAAMMAAFQQPKSPGTDMDAVMRANQRNVEALAEANRAAAEAYKDMLDKQMEIFSKMTEAARQQYQWADESAGGDKLRERTAAMNGAVEEALSMMKKLAESARDANAEAYAQLKGQVDDAVTAISRTAT